MTDEYKPLKNIERGLTICDVHKDFTGVVDACCVRSAVLWIIQELELLKTLADEDYNKYDDRSSGGEALAYGIAIDKIKFGFPVLFEDEELRENDI